MSQSLGSCQSGRSHFVGRTGRRSPSLETGPGGSGGEEGRGTGRGEVEGKGEGRGRRKRVGDGGGKQRGRLQEGLRPSREGRPQLIATICVHHCEVYLQCSVTRLKIAQVNIVHSKQTHICT